MKQQYNNKKKNNKNKVIVLIVIFLILVLIGLYAYTKKKMENKKNIDDFINVEELVEYFGCTYIKKEKSTEANYTDDIYIKFKIAPISDIGTSNQDFYEEVISAIQTKNGDKNIRIIDESNEIIIRIIYNSDTSSTTYIINDDTNYFKTMLLKYQSSKTLKQTSINDTISNELQSIINVNWIRRNAQLGSIDNSVKNYDIYYDEGYKIKTIGTKIFNIIFTKKYKNQIIGGIKTGMDNTDIENLLGVPNFKESSLNLIGYKTDKFYIFFIDGEISIYRNDTLNEEKNNNFANLFNTLETSGDYSTFIDKLTDLYSDYDEIYRDTNYTYIKYSNLGFEVKFGVAKGNGLILYSNYKGKVTDTITIDDIEKNNIPTNVSTQLDKDLIEKTEERRVTQDIENRKPNVGNFLLKTNSYVVLCDENNNIDFYSIGKDNIDSELNLSDFTGIYSFNDNIFIYGIANGGIYIYDAISLKSAKIIAGTNEEFKITKVENNTVYYDNTSIEIK